MILLDGKSLSQKILARVANEVAALGKPLKLVIVQVGRDGGSDVYIGQKMKAAANVGIQAEHLMLPETLATEELVQKIYALNEDIGVHGILVQLPLPKHIDTPVIFKSIDPAKDVDGFTAYNIGKMFLDKKFEKLVPCTPRGIIHLLEDYKIDVMGKEAVVVGVSNIVGKPLATMLVNRRATVTMCHSKTQDLAFHTRRADLLFVAIGKAKFITADMVKEGVIVVDVGMNRDEQGKLCGDVDFEAVSKKASFITPVPGGVGPMTVACLMENVVKAAQRM
ncbi:MAG: bifunctional 5,10-methylenetetrahydrofolate dehydrogenase/5,10-methenyltetrahydrofolate cyclohydrolase [Patescibacteria group bacterium]